MTNQISPETVGELETYFEDVRSDYSGRGMYGKNCLAIVSDETGWTLRSELENVLEDLDPDNDSELIEDIRHILERAPREDNMGRSTVYYWPSIEVGEE